MKKKKIRAVDIGNTFAKAATVDCVSFTCSQLVSLPTEQCLESPAQALKKLLGSNCTEVVLSSVVPAVLEALGDAAMEQKKTLKPLTAQTRFPFEIDYLTPQSLGSDRLANALYCCRRHRARSSIMICAGSALTVDMLADGGYFRGGAILPGPQAMARSLKSATAQLPGIEFFKGEVSLPGRSTVECIRSGVLFGLAGSIEKIVGLYLQMHPGSRIVASGGAWPLLAPLVNLSVQHEPHMTLIGTALAFMED